MTIPLSEPDITEAEIAAVTAVLRSGRLSLGPCAEEFEAKLAEYVGVPHAVAVSSGTAGLHLCLLALGIGAGDEVIVPSFAFIAAANAIRYVGATPVFVDIDPVSLNMDLAAVEAAISPRTRAVMAVHTFGLPVAMEALLDVARRHHLRVIEDACEALGAVCGSRPAGSFGDAAVFAFYPNKQITTGEGGMVVTRDARVAAEVRAMRNQGRMPGDAWHQHTLLGYNYRLSEIHAALGCAQMQRLPGMLAQRAAVADRYAYLLRGDSRIQLPVRHHAGCTSSWFVYVIRIPAAVRDRVQQLLALAGVQCGRYFAPIHQQPAYAELRGQSALPVTERESLRTLALPFYNRLTAVQATYVAEHLRSALDSSEQ